MSTETNLAVGLWDKLTDTMSSVSEGIVGRVVTSQQTMVVGDVSSDPHYIEVVPGMQSTLAVPLVHKNKPVGALNVLSGARLARSSHPDPTAGSR